METIKSIIIKLSIMIIVLMFVSGCNQTANEKTSSGNQIDITTIEKEIELRLRDFEKHLQNGDSIAIADMYTPDAEIMPLLDDREKIIKNFGGMIRAKITGSSFNSVNLWGNEDLVVEQGTGIWSHENGKVVETGKYLVVWKKENETWKILRDIWFADKSE